jgi:hypothetical protein
VSASQYFSLCLKKSTAHQTILVVIEYYFFITVQHKFLPVIFISFFLVLPENVRVVFTPEMAERGKPFVIKCEAEANPPPTFKIFLNATEVPAVCGDTHIIYEVNDSHVGSYKCVAENQLGSSSSTSRYLRVAVRPNTGKIFKLRVSSVSSNCNVCRYVSNVSINTQ